MITSANFVTLTGYAQRVFDNGKIVAFTLACYSGKHKESQKNRYDYIPCILFPGSASTLCAAMNTKGGWEKCIQDKSITVTAKLIHGKSFNAKLNVEVYKTDVVVESVAINAIQSTESGSYAGTTPTQPAGQAPAPVNSLPEMEDDLPF